MFFAPRFREIWQVAGMKYALAAIKLVANTQLLARTLNLPLTQAPTLLRSA